MAKKPRSKTAGFLGSRFRRMEPLSRRVIDTFKNRTLMSHLQAASQDPLRVLLPSGARILEGMLNEKILPTQGGFNIYQRHGTYAKPLRIGGSEMGELITKEIVIMHGAKDTQQMKIAKQLYKVQNIPAFNSEASRYYGDIAWPALFSAAGEGRQGVWTPHIYNRQNDIGSSSTDAVKNKVALYSSLGASLLSKNQMYSELRSNFLTANELTWLDNRYTQSADKYFAICYMQDEVTISNGMTYLPVDLKIYLCKCKQDTEYGPAQAWYDPRPASSFQDVMDNSYVYGQDGLEANQEFSCKLPSESGISPASASTFTAASSYAYTSVHLGATPFFSVQFRENWEVMDVIKQRIFPTDKFELKLKREFSEAYSVRMAENQRDRGKNHMYDQGDYALLITFRGTPCMMHYDGVDTATDIQKVREVEVSPSKIMVHTRSSFGIAAPKIDVDAFKNDTSTGITIESNVITSTARMLDTTTITRSFGDTIWNPEVITNVEQQQGGERT